MALLGWIQCWQCKLMFFICRVYIPEKVLGITTWLMGVVFTVLIISGSRAIRFMELWWYQCPSRWHFTERNLIEPWQCINLWKQGTVGYWLSNFNCSWNLFVWNRHTMIHIQNNEMNNSMVNVYIRCFIEYQDVNRKCVVMPHMTSKYHLVPDFDPWFCLRFSHTWHQDMIYL